MRKICPSPYKAWLQNQNIKVKQENKQTEENSNNIDIDESFYFTFLAQKENLSTNDGYIFVAIKLPTNVFIYEWFKKDITFRVLKDFVLAMDVSHEYSYGNNRNFIFSDLIYEQYEFLDDETISVVFEREQEALKNNEVSSSRIPPSNRIFLKVKVKSQSKRIQFIFQKKC